MTLDPFLPLVMTWNYLPTHKRRSYWWLWVIWINRTNDGTLRWYPAMVLCDGTQRWYPLFFIQKPFQAIYRRKNSYYALKIEFQKSFSKFVKNDFLRIHLKRKVIIKSLHLKNDEIKLFRLIKKIQVYLSRPRSRLCHFFQTFFLGNFVCSFDSFQKRQNFCFIRFFSAKKSNVWFKERMQERKMMNQNTINLLSSMWVF